MLSSEERHTESHRSYSIPACCTMSAAIKWHICLSILFTLRQALVSCRSGFISETILDSKFYCDTSSMKVFKTASELQCVHKCAIFEKCELVNYWMDDKGERNCEVFQLPRSHKSCRMTKDESNWKAVVFQVGHLHFIKLHFAQIDYSKFLRTCKNGRCILKGK